MPPKNYWPIELADVARLLNAATDYADTLQSGPWQFAVEIAELQNRGLSRADLRSLVLRGLIEHAEELPAQVRKERRFQPTGKLSFSDRTCFILSECGRAAAALLLAGQQFSESTGQILRIGSQDVSAPGGGRCVLLFQATPSQRSEAKPFWNKDLGRLLMGELLVKEYHVPAQNQYLVLAAFQEENWPRRIDDPLPHSAEIDPKRRLHLTIGALNRCHKNRVLRFCGDGTGRGVRWLAV